MWNALMIDCSRLMERHAAYHDLVERMAHEGMNALVLHFADDFGLGARLPGFGELAMPHAFSPRDARRLHRHAGARGIDLVPEIECFGHTRFLTEHPRYRPLAATTPDEALRFNALDPTHPDTAPTVRRLIRSVCAVFPGRFVHIGCDEVDLGDVADRAGIDPAVLWTDHVNRVIGFVHEAGRTPMMWADHVVADAGIRDRLRRDVILVHWDYTAEVGDDPVRVLRDAGFDRLILAPALACYGHRFVVPERALANVDRMARFARDHATDGVLTTVWCPWRYLQAVIPLGVAWAARAVREGGAPDRDRLHDEFVRRSFGVAPTPAALRFLELLPRLDITRRMARALITRGPEAAPDPLVAGAEPDRFAGVAELAEEAVAAARQFRPRTGRSTWDGMTLAARCVRLCALAGAGRDGGPGYDRESRKVRDAFDREWDRTRFPDDPQKTRPRFPNHDDQYAAVLLARAAGDRRQR